MPNTQSQGEPLILFDLEIQGTLGRMANNGAHETREEATSRLMFKDQEQARQEEASHLNENQCQDAATKMLGEMNYLRKMLQLISLGGEEIGGTTIT